MDNPAFRLAELLESWRKESSTPVEARGGNHPGDASFWRTQAEAVSLVRELDEAIAALEATPPAVWDPHLAEWYRGVFSFNTGWNTRGSVSTSTAESIGMLHALGAILQYAKPPHTALTVGQREDLLGAVQDAVQLVKDPEADLSESERFYVLELLNATRHLLDATEVTDRVDLQAHIDQLMGTLSRLSAQFSEAGDEERGGKFRDAFVRVYRASRQVLYDSAAIAAIASGTIDATRSITG
jgi:hypothetical protein